jgi:hypothetical protein
MKRLRKHRKLIYVSGMISLLLLPIIGYAYFHYNKSWVVYRSMDFALPDQDSRYPDVASGLAHKSLTLDNVKVMRKYKSFELNGSEDSETEKLNAIRSELHRIKQTGDTINGVKVHFGKTAQYDSFIRTLDYLAITGTPLYGLFGDDLYALAPAPPKPSKNIEINTWTCGGYWTNDVINDELSKWDVIQSALQKDWKIYSVFAALMLINIFSLVRFNANKILYLKNHSDWHF